jgi:dihydrodipicolinate synthase/N-acetylneuraminate lyase
MAEICVALLTPFTTSGDVALGALAMHTEFLIAQGVTSLMPCGTTGEGTLLEPREVVDVVRCVAHAASGRAQVLAHVGRPSTRETVALAQRVLEVGVAAVSAVVPYYYKYSDAQVRDHYLALLDAVSAPVYAYTIPDRTGNTLSSSVVRELAGAGLKGVKDSSKSLELHREYLAAGIDVLMGSDALVLEAFRLGAAGAVSAIANIEPTLLLELAQCFALEHASALQARIVAIRDRTRASTSAIAAMKRELAARLPGYPVHTRAPLS